MSGSFDAHLPWIKGELAVSPAASLAISIDMLARAAESHELGLDLIQDFAMEIDPDALEGQLAQDIRLVRDAMAVLRDGLLGMSYLNFAVNVRDCGWELSDFAPAQIAKDLIARIAAAEPRLGKIILNRPALVPF